MNINRLLKNKNITKYKLSKLSGIPYTTLNDVCSGKTSIEKCSGETIYKLSKHLDVSMEDLIRDECLKNEKERSCEYGLPSYLQHDLDEYKNGLKENSSLLDCLWCELYASINGAEIDDEAITSEHANYLRKKYLFGDKEND